MFQRALQICTIACVSIVIDGNVMIAVNVEDFRNLANKFLSKDLAEKLTNLVSEVSQVNRKDSEENAEKQFILTSSQIVGGLKELVKESKESYTDATAPGEGDQMSDQHSTEDNTPTPTVKRFSTVKSSDDQLLRYNDGNSLPGPVYVRDELENLLQDINEVRTITDNIGQNDCITHKPANGGENTFAQEAEKLKPIKMLKDQTREDNISAQEVYRKRKPITDDDIFSQEEVRKVTAVKMLRDETKDENIYSQEEGRNMKPIKMLRYQIRDDNVYSHERVREVTPIQMLRDETKDDNMYLQEAGRNMKPVKMLRYQIRDDHVHLQEGASKVLPIKMLRDQTRDDNILSQEAVRNLKPIKILRDNTREDSIFSQEGVRKVTSFKMLRKQTIERKYDKQGDAYKKIDYTETKLGDWKYNQGVSKEPIALKNLKTGNAGGKRSRIRPVNVNYYEAEMYEYPREANFETVQYVDESRLLGRKDKGKFFEPHDTHILGFNNEYTDEVKVNDQQVNNRDTINHYILGPKQKQHPIGKPYNEPVEVDGMFKEQTFKIQNKISTTKYYSNLFGAPVSDSKNKMNYEVIPPIHIQEITSQETKKVIPRPKNSKPESLSRNPLNAKEGKEEFETFIKYMLGSKEKETQEPKLPKTPKQKPIEKESRGVDKPVNISEVKQAMETIIKQNKDKMENDELINTHLLLKIKGSNPDVNFSTTIGDNSVKGASEQLGVQSLPHLNEHESGSETVDSKEDSVRDHNEVKDERINTFTGFKKENNQVLRDSKNVKYEPVDEHIAFKKYKKSSTDSNSRDPNLTNQPVDDDVIFNKEGDNISRHPKKVKDKRIDEHRYKKENNNSLTDRQKVKHEPVDERVRFKKEKGNLSRFSNKNKEETLDEHVRFKKEKDISKNKQSKIVIEENDRYKKIALGSENPKSKKRKAKQESEEEENKYDDNASNNNGNKEQSLLKSTKWYSKDSKYCKKYPNSDKCKDKEVTKKIALKEFSDFSDSKRDKLGSKRGEKGRISDHSDENKGHQEHQRDRFIIGAGRKLKRKPSKPIEENDMYDKFELGRETEHESDRNEKKEKVDRDMKTNVGKKKKYNDRNRDNSGSNEDAMIKNKKRNRDQKVTYKYKVSKKDQDERRPKEGYADDPRPDFKEVKPDSIKANTESLLGESVEVKGKRRITKKYTMKGTHVPKRDFYKLSSPNYYKDLPRVVDKYDFDEPLPEKDREREKKDNIKREPARINKKVKLTIYESDL